VREHRIDLVRFRDFDRYELDAASCRTARACGVVGYRMVYGLTISDLPTFDDDEAGLYQTPIAA